MDPADGTRRLASILAGRTVAGRTIDPACHWVRRAFLPAHFRRATQKDKEMRKAIFVDLPGMAKAKARIAALAERRQQKRKYFRRTLQPLLYSCIYDVFGRL
jgi:hypothetical protein